MTFATKGITTLAALVALAACNPAGTPVTASVSGTQTQQPMLVEPRPVPIEVEEALRTFDSVCVARAGDRDALIERAGDVRFRLRQTRSGALEGSRRSPLGFRQEIQISAPDAPFRCEVLVKSAEPFEQFAITIMMRRQISTGFVHANGSTYKYDHTARRTPVSGTSGYEHEFELRFFQ
jgi:hypothetical protein